MLSLLVQIDDENEPYSPGGSDDELPGVSQKIPTTLPEDEMRRKMDEISRQIEMQKREIELLSAPVNDEPYSPSGPVSPSTQFATGVDSDEQNIIPGLGDIPIPSNLADILKTIKGPSTDMPIAMSSAMSYGANNISDEYTPINPVSTIYQSVVDYIPATTANQAPGKLAQMTDEELLRMVPDDSLISPPPAKKTRFDVEPLPPGVDNDEYIP